MWHKDLTRDIISCCMDHKFYMLSSLQGLFLQAAKSIQTFVKDRPGVLAAFLGAAGLVACTATYRSQNREALDASRAIRTTKKVVTSDDWAFIDQISDEVTLDALCISLGINLTHIETLADKKDELKEILLSAYLKGKPAGDVFTDSFAAMVVILKDIFEDYQQTQNKA